MKMLTLAALLSLCWIVSGCGSAGDVAVVPPPNSGSPPQRFVPSAVALPIIPAAEFLVTAYGAIANDGLDDTAAIQKAIDALSAAGGGTIIFPPGRYDISIDARINRALTLVPKLRFLSRPEGQATIRLADNQKIYEGIMAAATYPTRLDDAEFVGMVFDANGQNNPVRNADETNGDLHTPTLRYVIRTFAGNRVRVHNCTFINNDNANTLSFNGSAVADITVSQSRFLNTGGVLVDHDHSSIYTYANRVLIANNEFKSRNGAGTLGARTAIETHSDDVEVRGNTIDGFLQGTNIVGRITDPSRQRYVGNTFKNVGVGINIWSLTERAFNPTKPAFVDLILEKNVITIDADRWWASPAMVVNSLAGIHFESHVSDADITRLDILDNQITFETFAGKRIEADRYSAGITLRGAEGKLVIGALNVARNTITNAIGSGILSATTVGGASASSIIGNTIKNAGRSPLLRGEGDPLRAGIVIANAANNLSITNNSVATDSTPASTVYGAVLVGNCAGTCLVTGILGTGLKQTLLLSGTGWTASP